MYCTVENVQGLTLPTSAYSATSRPTVTQVETFIEDIFAHLNSKIRRAGYTLPITHPDGLRLLRLANALGAAALAEEALGARGNGPVSTVSMDYWAKYQSIIKDIIEVPGLLDGSGETIQAKSLWTSRTCDGSDENYSDITPFFRRDDAY